MLLAMVSDVRVVLVKLADRLHNMRTLNFLAPGKAGAHRARDSRYLRADRAPSGNGRHTRRTRRSRVQLSRTGGISTNCKDEVRPEQREFEEFLDEVQDTIRNEACRKRNPGRSRRRVSSACIRFIRKRSVKKRTLDQVYDLLAVRIVTDSVRNCYAALGVVHQIWRPVPGRFKDYIAMPRPNLYQSLHTTVIHAGQPFEVQIRTQPMHRIAEQGVAAHWRYKDGAAISEGDDQRIIWMRKLIEWAREMREPSEFMSTLKVDLYPEEVYTFTPKGKVLALPRGATPMDFAYTIHTEVGHQCVGAKVNGQIVPLRHRLANGDVVEIMTQNGHASQSRLA